MADSFRELVWHDDGHQIYMRLEKSLVRVNPMDCPFEDSEEAFCYHMGVGGCAVRFFIQMYGLDVNVGVADPMSEMPISWAMQGDKVAIDQAQVWIIPNHDPQFAAFLEAERNPKDD